jgi:hypothetical protein
MNIRRTIAALVALTATTVSVQADSRLDMAIKNGAVRTLVKDAQCIKATSTCAQYIECIVSAGFTPVLTCEQLKEKHRKLQQTRELMMQDCMETGDPIACRWR